MDSIPSPALPAIAPPATAPATPRPPLLPECSDFLEGDAPAADKVQAFPARALDATGPDAPTTAGALVPLICDALLSNHSVKAYGRDLLDFFRHIQAQGVDPLHVTADQVKLYKRALLEAGRTSATVARRLSVLRGAYQQLATKGLVSWETAQDLAAVEVPGVQKNSTPWLTRRQAVALLEAIPTDTLQGLRDPAMMSVFFLTGCRVSAVVGACVGHLETDGVEHYLHVTEKRNKRRRKTQGPVDRGVTVPEILPAWTGERRDATPDRPLLRTESGRASPRLPGAIPSSPPPRGRGSWLAGASREAADDWRSPPPAVDRAPSATSLSRQASGVQALE